MVDLLLNLGTFLLVAAFFGVIIRIIARSWIGED